MRAKIGVAVLVLLTGVFVWGMAWMAAGFARAGSAVGWGLAVAVVLLVVLTIWVTWREVRFGMQSGRLARMYGPAADGEPALQDAQPQDRDARAAQARREFEAARAALETGAGEDWRAWYRLALAYDGMRDRAQARAALRRAISLERSGR
ncbi:hypothetical protein Bequi_01565 [Brachybacterium sp. JHP9]|uniref:Tetratricopeptide repeat protein n=1 Tax=Brachybacterium equifaecis TaxID=2910770 RepID=A0ABT0QY12_9MICO|nr:hypothetical protein [Brachybacterium equifaecis]MCL6422088.1 hypothetical protein [Brachybacterium equifaecis]